MDLAQLLKIASFETATFSCFLIRMTQATGSLFTLPSPHFTRFVSVTLFKTPCVKQHTVTLFNKHERRAQRKDLMCRLHGLRSDHEQGYTTASNLESAISIGEAQSNR